MILREKMEEIFNFTGYRIVTDKIDNPLSKVLPNTNYRGICRESALDLFEPCTLDDKGNLEQSHKRKIELVKQQSIYLREDESILYPEGPVREAHKVYQEYEDRFDPYMGIQNLEDFITEFDVANKIYYILRDGGINISFLRCEVNEETGLADDGVRGKFLGYDIATYGGSDCELPLIEPNHEYARHLNENGLFISYEIAKEFFEKYEVGKDDSLDWYIHRLSEPQVD